MIDKLLIPNFNSITVDVYLRSLGINISECIDGVDTEPKSSIRLSSKQAIYGFKEIADAINLITFLNTHKIPYYIPAPSTGARYPNHVVIKNPLYKEPCV